MDTVAPRKTPLPLCYAVLRGACRYESEVADKLLRSWNPTHFNKWDTFGKSFNQAKSQHPINRLRRRVVTSVFQGGDSI